MPMYLQSGMLLLALLNPFLLTVYLADVFEKLSRRDFLHVMCRATLIAGAVYCCFAVLGDVIFTRIIQAEFASFQIFGGIVFLLIGLQFVFHGPTAISLLRGESQHLAGAIAMPILIGPGTISACVVIGKRHDATTSCVVVFTALLVAVGMILLMKTLHDIVRPRNADLVERYLEIAGRVTALYAGTVAIDMMMRGLGTWMQKF